MQRIQYIPDVEWCGLDGTVLKDASGNPVKKSQLSFFVERLNDLVFTKHRQAGIDALTYAVTTKLELDNQKEMAAERGYWLLEDDRAEALKRAALTPSEPYNNFVAIPLITLLQTLKDMKQHQ